MPDDNSQAAELAQVQEAAVPEGETSPQPEPQKETLTAEDVRRILKDEFIPEVKSTIQSQVAKGENRINQRIQERMQALVLNKGVLNLSDEQVLQAQDKIVREETIKSYQPEAQPTEQEPANREIDPIVMLNDHVNAVFNFAGTAVQKNDPEFKELQDGINKAWAIEGPEGLVILQQAAMSAAVKKTARIAAQQKHAAGRLPSGGGEQSTSDPRDISQITDPKILYRMGEEKLTARK